MRSKAKTRKRAVDSEKDKNEAFFKIGMQLLRKSSKLNVNIVRQGHNACI